MPKKITLIHTETCVRCPFVKGPLEKIAEKNWWEFEYKLYTDEPITSVPALLMDEKYLDYDEILDFINKNQ